MEDMKIEEQSDSEILKIAEPIWDEISEGCRTKDWSKYSQFFPDDDRENFDHKKGVFRKNCGLIFGQEASPSCEIALF